MTRFIVLTFGFLGWGYYELSGGADFVPEVATVEITEPAEAVVAQVVAPAVEPEVAQDIVARAETETLMTLAAAYEPQPAEETQPAGQRPVAPRPRCLKSTLMAGPGC